MENFYNMKNNNNSTFYKLGKIIGVTAQSGDVLNNSPEEQIQHLENIIYDKEHVDYQKKFASIVVSIMDSFGNPTSPAYLHLKKIAAESYANWNDHCEEVIDTCISALKSNNVDSKEFSKVASAAELALRAGSIPASIGLQTAGMLIPAAGALGGGLSWIAEKELSEDDVNTEILKAKIKEYQRLSAEIEKRLVDRYNYKVK